MISARLSDLDPQWIPLGGYSREHGGFVFRVPGETGWRLLVKCIVADENEQVLACRARGIPPSTVVMAPRSRIWRWIGESFLDLTLEPDIQGWEIVHGTVSR